jgi:hypothetical protein
MDEGSLPLVGRFPTVHLALQPPSLRASPGPHDPSAKGPPLVVAGHEGLVPARQGGGWKELETLESGLSDRNRAKEKTWTRTKSQEYFWLSHSCEIHGSYYKLSENAPYRKFF